MGTGGRKAAAVAAAAWAQRYSVAARRRRWRRLATRRLGGRVAAHERRARAKPKCAVSQATAGMVVQESGERAGDVERCGACVEAATAPAAIAVAHTHANVTSSAVDGDKEEGSAADPQRRARGARQCQA